MRTADSASVTKAKTNTLHPSTLPLLPPTNDYTGILEARTPRVMLHVHDLEQSNLQRRPSRSHERRIWLWAVILRKWNATRAEQLRFNSHENDQG